MLKILTSSQSFPEKRYILDVFFREFLGVDFCHELMDEALHEYRIILPNGKILIVEDHFFSRFGDGLAYLDEKNIPSIVRYAKCRFLPEEDIPVIYGEADDPLIISDDSIRCKIDVFASSFFMLTRWEEYINRTRDRHDRFPATASLAFKNGFLGRPVVNEYVEFLWNMMKTLVPELRRGQRESKILVSCDVDRPYAGYINSFLHSIRAVGGDLLKRRSPKLAMRTVMNFFASNMGYYNYDPFNTFDKIMDINEKIDNKVAFYFKTGKTSEQFDAGYNLDEPRIRKLIKRIYERGHEIGLHPSYDTYKDEVLLKQEADTLMRVMEKENIKQDKLGCRMHYLRWSMPETARHIETAGIDYDTTLGYADQIGFRCGICYEYTMFDFLDGKRMKLHQRPLIVMDGTVRDEMGYGYSNEAFKIMKIYKNMCRKIMGQFTILWHNSSLEGEDAVLLYQAIISD